MLVGDQNNGVPLQYCTLDFSFKRIVINNIKLVIDITLDHK